MNSCLSVPAEAVIGFDALEKAKGTIHATGKKALVVTGRHVSQTDFARLFFEVLKSSGVSHAVFDGITGEPTDKMIEDGSRLYIMEKCDFCIGLGGGSPIDAAKLIALKAANPLTFSLYKVPDIPTEAVPPVVAIPTTAGTGSEATRYAVATDTENDRKLLVSTPHILPHLAVIDYRAGITTPASVKASSGIDALTHAIEAYISIKSNPLTDDLAVSAVRRIVNNIVDYVSDNNTEAACEMAVAAFEAGICINNSSVTLVHGMSRPIGALFHVPHGLSNAMLLSVCLKDMARSSTKRFSQLAKYAGLANVGDTEDTAVEKLLGRVGQICRECRIPTLKEYGIDRSEFIQAVNKMSADAISSGSPANAPGNYTEADCRRLYLEAYEADKTEAK